MHDPVAAIIGAVLLVITALAFFKLAPREGRSSIAWLERESVAMTVVLVLYVLAVFGAGLVIKAVV